MLVPLPRTRPRPTRGRRSAAVLLAAATIQLTAAAAAAQPQPTRPETPPHFAITNARIVTVAGPVIETGTVVVRDGIIRAVGADVQAPADAWLIDGAGLTVYPGLMDAFTTLGHPERGGDQGDEGAGGGTGDEEYAWGPDDRKGTFTFLTAADELDPGDDRIANWRNAGFTTALSTRARGIFPGQAAVIDLAGERGRAMVVSPSVAQRVNLNGRGFPGYPRSLLGVFAYIKQLYFDAQHYDRAWTAYEADPRGQPRPEYDPTLEPLRTPAPVLFPADGRKEILRAIRTAGEIGAPVVVYGAQRAYEAVDVLREHRVPVLVDLDWPRPPRNRDPELEPTLATLRSWEHAPTTPAKLAAAGVRFAFYTGELDDPDDVRSRIERAIDAGLTPDAALRALTLAPARILGVADRLGSIEPGKIANLVVTDGDLFDTETEIRRVVVDGRVFDIFEAAPAVASRDSDRGGQPADSAQPAPAGKAAEPADSFAAPSGPPVPMADDRGPYREDPVTLIRNATILTASNGTIEGGDILIRDGRIAEIGQGLDAPGNAAVVDATGMYVTPGIIDAHSHLAADAINEGTVNVSAMVGIEDVLDPEDVGIYRALAGGVTSINVLHGSANPIGGKNAVLKLRWGADGQQMIFEAAPDGIKFALGENTKRDRDPDRYPSTRMGVQDVIRQAFIDAKEYMRAWEEYEERDDDDAVPPRRDLKLETLAEILRGERLVHAHSYRADEILMLIRLAEEMGFRIATFQHVLEGYKVADEIAAHGAGASTFSDWWAYKVEAYDAIPHNAALMTERGVVASINSDSGEEIRHLNQEAAKSIKWGGLSEEQALRLVTLNPAKQLRIADRTGSIEVGKDADIVVWNGHPLSMQGVPQKTYVDGMLYFDIELDRQRQDAIEREIRALMDKHLPRPSEAAPVVTEEAAAPAAAQEGVR